MEIKEIKDVIGEIVEEKIIKVIKEHVDPFFTAIQENFNTINERFDSIDERFKRLEERTERIEHQLSSLERRAFAIEEILTEHQRELKSIKEILFAMKTNGEKNQRRVVDLEQRITRMEEKVFA